MGVRQGCVMSSSLFNVFIDGILIEVSDIRGRGFEFCKESEL